MSIDTKLEKNMHDKKNFFKFISSFNNKALITNKKSKNLKKRTDFNMKPVSLNFINSKSVDKNTKTKKTIIKFNGLFFLKSKILFL